MLKVYVSNSVANDFKKAENIVMSRQTANNLLGSCYDNYFKCAKENGWTNAENLADYIERDHGAIYTAAFLKAYGL